MTEFWAHADHEDAMFRGDQLQCFGPLDALRTTGILIRGEDLTEVECDACGDAHLETVTWTAEPPGTESRAYIGCPVAGSVRVERERLEVWRIDFDNVARVAARALEFRDAPHIILDGRIWLLGNRRFNERARDAFLVRGSRWHNGDQLISDHVRLSTSPCPVILVPNLLPDASGWRTNGRVLLSMSEFDWFGDDSHEVSRKVTAVVAEHDRWTTVVAEALFRKDGGTWTLSFKGKTIHLQDMLGLSYIAELLRKPGVAIEAAALAGASIGSTKLTPLPGMPITDEAAIKAVRADLAERKTELASFQTRDWTREGALREKISILEKYLGEVETHQGHARKVAGTAQRSRTSVTNAIKRAIDHISMQHSDLGRHLKESIKTGVAPTYAPVAFPDWQF